VTKFQIHDSLNLLHKGKRLSGSKKREISELF